MLMLWREMADIFVMSVSNLYRKFKFPQIITTNLFLWISVISDVEKMVSTA